MITRVSIACRRAVTQFEQHRGRAAGSQADGSLVVTDSAAVAFSPRLSGQLVVSAVLAVNNSTYNSQGTIAVQPGKVSLSRDDCLRASWSRRQ